MALTVDPAVLVERIATVTPIFTAQNVVDKFQSIGCIVTVSDVETMLEALGYESVSGGRGWRLPENVVQEKLTVCQRRLAAVERLLKRLPAEIAKEYKLDAWLAEKA